MKFGQLRDKVLGLDYNTDDDADVMIEVNGSLFDLDTLVIRTNEEIIEPCPYGCHDGVMLINEHSACLTKYEYNCTSCGKVIYK